MREQGVPLETSEQPAAAAIIATTNSATRKEVPRVMGVKSTQRDRRRVSFRLSDGRRRRQTEATGPQRTREAVEQLLRHPFLDRGQALHDADAVLLSHAGRA